jgi:hypothetical protein
VIIATFIGVLVIFAMWVSLWENVWRTAVELTRANVYSAQMSRALRSFGLPSLVFDVVAVGGV